MVEEWCEPSAGMNLPLCLMPLWDVELAVAEIQRNADRGVRAFCFSELPTRLNLPSIHTEYVEKMIAELDAEVAYKVSRRNAIRMLELDRV
jgi:hypothetical protein